MIRLVILLPILLLAACGSFSPPTGVAFQDTGRPTAASNALAEALTSLGPGVDPQEAARAARIAHDYPLALARAWDVTDPPLVHNTKVNLGLKPEGLCSDWAHALTERMAAEQFQTLDLHWGVANAFNPFRITHNTLIVSAKGGRMEQGIILDPWRKGGGHLYWGPTAQDPEYAWLPLAEVHDRKRKARSRRN